MWYLVLIVLTATGSNGQFHPVAIQQEYANIETCTVAKNRISNSINKGYVALAICTAK